MRRRTIATVMIVVLVILAGCSGLGGDQGDQAAPGSDGAGGAGGDQAANGDSSLQTDGSTALQVQQRKLIRTGEIRLQVDDTEAASTAVRDLADERGGFVSASNRRVREHNNETWRTERIVIRVPGERFDETVVDIESLGQVQSAETNTEDVTDQLVDIEARLENLRAERDRLRALYEDANETEDVLKVQRELAEVQEEIERLEAKRASLERDVALSSITVHITEERPESSADDGAAAWYDTSVTTAFLQSVSGVATTLRALVVAGAYLAPYVVVFGTPLAGAAALWYRRGE